MMKRFMSFRKDKSQANGINGSNGHANGATNGTANGTNGSAATDPKAKRQSFVKRASSGFMKSNGTNGVNGTHHEHEEDHATTRSDVDSSFAQFAQLIHASRRPMPTQSGDGSYIEHEVHSGLLADIKALGIKDVKTLGEVISNKDKLQDDRTMLMERVIQLVSALPEKSKAREDLTNQFIGELWGSLEHAPQNYLGDKYRYRQADGSYNNIRDPMLGAANTAYARSVLPGTLQPGALPDPGLVFDSVFARTEFKPHANKVSSIMYYWASLVIHDLFQTNHRDYNISMTSSYLDLSTLYGDTQEDQDQIRTFKDGKLKPDCYSEERVLGMPPGCGIFLIMFNRYHNWIVEQLAAINENGRFNKPKEGLAEEQAKAAWKKYDNDLFQTGRLITCGLYMNITLGDYLRTIVNLNRSNTTWTLDPRVAMGKKVMGEPSTPRGGGNQVSAEFNLVYRWHSSISKKDEAWTEALYKRLFGKHAAEVSLPELMQGLGKWSASLPKDPYERDYHGLKRGADGRFNDDELVNILCDSIEDVSGASGPNNVPKALRAVEILGMQQARHWECASLNEFRKFFGLKPHETFEHINPDPEVANQLRHLYEHPDFVELYPGIIAEDAKKPMVPGVGCAPTYTVSRAILSDAVTLVRSDRFYTTDYHPKNLTNFGYTAVQYDLGVEQGCVFYKLFLRAFPHHFQQNSIYAHYPMTVPSENRKIMQTLGREAHYNYDRPGFIPLRINLTSYIGAKYMLERPQEFNVTWGAATGFVMGKGGFDFMLSGDTPFHAQQKQIMSKALYKNRWQIAVKTFYEHITLQLLHDYSAKVAGVNQVDITRDVGNLAHVHFASSIFSLPLKTKANPRGIYTEHELWMVMSVVFMAIFFDFDPAVSFPLRQAAYSVGHGLGKVIEAKVKAMNMTSWVSSVVDGYLENHDELKDYGVHMVRKLLESGLGPYEAAWSQILPVAVAMVPNQSQVFTQMLDYFLGEGADHMPDIQRLAAENTDEADEKLMHYVMEGIRLNGTFGSYREAKIATTIDDGGRPVEVKPGDKIFCSFVSANRDPAIFPNPNVCDPNRPLDSYIHYGIGPHKCLGMEASRVGLTAMFKVVAGLKNLRRAPGPQGQLKYVPRPGGFKVYMSENQGSYWAFPTTMKLHYDGELPALPN